MNVLRVSKKPENLDENQFLKEALKELQGKMKAKGETFTFDIEAREVRKKGKKITQ